MRTLDVQQSAWIHRARARRHGNAFERRKAHRGVDRASIANGRDRAATTEVADDQSPRSFRCRAARLHARQTTGRRARGSRTAGSPSPRARFEGSHRSWPRPAWWRGKRCRTRRRADARAATSVRRRSLQVRERCEVAQSARGPRSTRAPRRRSPSARRDVLRGRRGDRRRRPPPDERPRDRSTTSTRLVLPDDVQLEAGGPGVDDENREHALSRARSSRGSPDRRRRARAYTREPRDAGPPSPAADVRR